jgi:hypothetical protein
LFGGPQTLVKSVVHAVSHRQPADRCSVSRRADEAIRAGAAISLQRMVAVVARANGEPVMVAAARVRLNAIAARTSHAEFAANDPEGK